MTNDGGSLRHKIVMTAAALIATSFPALAAEPSAILAQLACNGTPDPAPVLIDLARSGAIDVSAGTRQDSSTCWALTPPLALDGMSFSHVCASSEDPAAIAAHPDLFWRGPGTSPGTELALSAPVATEALEAWASKALPGDEPAYFVDESWRVSGASEISCVGHANDEPEDAIEDE